MYSTNSHLSDPGTVLRHFSLWEVCGRWVSRQGNEKMPEVQIYHTGTHYYRLRFFYDPKTVYSCALWQRWGVTWFYLYGRVELTYNTESDSLLICGYGEYIREEE